MSQRHGENFSPDRLDSVNSREDSLLTWDQIRESEKWRGQWVALCSCRYDEHTGEAVEGKIVDVDMDLASLCNRLRTKKRTNCAIMFVDDCAES